MEKVLYLLVENFSNATRESFFEKELPYLSEKFQKIYVVPLYPDNTTLSFFAPNVEVKDFNFFQPCNRPKILLSNFSKVCSILVFELARTHNKFFYLKNLKTNINDLLLKFSAANNLETFIKKDINSNTVFYSYWFMQWVAALSILKLKYPSLKIVSRVHGADYDEEQVKRTLPYRYFQLSKVNAVFPVSLFAKNYLHKKFKVDNEKIKVSRLGLLLNEDLAPINKNELHIVSCSSLIPLKRVELIVDILSNMNCKVKWTHFGDGPLMKMVKEKSQQLNNENVTCEFKGYVSNTEFLKYLKATPVSLFINVSESEGIPVTLMETIAFGIPVMGPAICGVPEIVTDSTGFLIPKHFNPSSVASIIKESHSSGKIYSEEFRKKVKNFYKENFYAPLNHQNLAGMMASI